MSLLGCRALDNAVGTLFQANRSGKSARISRGFIVCCLLASTAIAQTASEITPPTFEPEPQRLVGSVIFSGEPGLEAPAGAERLTVSIAGVDVQGALPGMDAAHAALDRRLTTGPVLVSEIFEAAAVLEAAYVEAGFVLARVVLPAQQLNNGDRLRLVVVDGFVEAIDTTAVPAQVRDRLEELTDQLIGRRGLQRGELERQILLAGDTYGIALASALQTGAQPGGTVIILEPRFRQVTGFVGFDNQQTNQLGDFSLNAGVEFNGFLGLGEAFYLRGSGHPDDFFEDTPRNRTFAVGGVFPVGSDGLSLGIEYTDSRTAPENATPTASTYKRLTLRVFYPFIRGRDANVTLRGSLDLQEDSQDVLAMAGPLPVYEDKISVLRFSADGAWIRESGAVVDLGATLSMGIDAFDARSAADAAASAVPLSRAGADVDFTKLEFSGGYRRPVGDKMAMSIAGQGQHSFGDALVTSEQFSIAGFQSLSSFASGTLSGDSGWYLRGELSRDLEMEAGERPIGLKPYIFAATGGVHRELPAVGEASNVSASSYGIGLEVIALRDEAFSNASLRMEIANGDRDDGGNDGSRISIFGALRF